MTPAAPPGIYRAVEPLVLASASPRRRELLASSGLVFEVLESGIEEGPAGGAPEETARRLALAKAEAVSAQRPAAWVIAADTLVVAGAAVLGKPASEEEARAMLRRLSGKTHEVVTGLALLHAEKGRRRTRTVATEVAFRRLSRAEIEAYAATGEPLDKAGAYGIQGLAAGLVRAVRGSYTNVVGLPLAETIRWLMEEGAVEARRGGA